ncbi:F-box protein At5g07610-like [Triticum dicoccoides]|uniref:F-box protein At5g07610-like n=1 Tax=Triticum dicoccoides TaxID=85692 RepID=UPI00188EA6E6|nr:F-box protein At5g07610-like [Triticum dicoccoides]
MAPRGCNKKKRGTKRSPVSDLSDDLLVEIISRVPYQSTCCCKCVSRRWRDLVSHPDHRKKLPRSTLAGIFYQTFRGERFPAMLCGYQSVSGNWCTSMDCSLSFLPNCKRVNMYLLDSCNGLLLCLCWNQPSEVNGFGYVVCNPATETWVTLPATTWSSKVRTARLGFDPSVSSHFHVFEFVSTTGVVDVNMQGHDTGKKTVGVYSSKAGVWTNGVVWDSPLSISRFPRSIFFNKMLHFSSDNNLVVAIDVEGNHRFIRGSMPDSTRGIPNVYLSRGQLHLANESVSELSIWALEDFSSENWTLKHSVSHLQLLGREYSVFAGNYRVISIHPEHNVIFIVCEQLYMLTGPSLTKLMAYEMDSRELRFICDLEWGCRTPYLPYVPLLSEPFADEQ